jgi:gentisate 1,2-dioxygenase
MDRAPLSSGDFAKVPSTLSIELPRDLLDAQVASACGDTAFSIERQHFVRAVKLPSRAISMTLGGLQPGQSTRLHRHNYETLIYVVRGSGVSVIGEREVPWRAGDAFYVPVWAWHRHHNTSERDDVLYVACENAPLLQNLGVAVREEA